MTGKDLLSGQPVGVDVPFQVIDADQGQMTGQGDRFGGIDTHEERTGQSGTVGYGNRVDVVPTRCASVMACSMIGMIASMCCREATSGTTPP